MSHVKEMHKRLWVTLRECDVFTSVLCTSCSVASSLILYISKNGSDLLKRSCRSRGNRRWKQLALHVINRPWSNWFTEKIRKSIWSISSGNIESNLKLNETYHFHIQVHNFNLSYYLKGSTCFNIQKTLSWYCLWLQLLFSASVWNM